MAWLVAAFCFVLTSPPAGAGNSPRGEWVSVKGGELLLPKSLEVPTAGLDVSLHLHGASATLEREWTKAKTAGVLATVNRKGLSSVYTAAFKDPAAFDVLLEEIRTRTGAAKIRRVVVSSFSAGFGGVRELLAVERHFRRIDALILADTVYAGFDGDSKLRQVSAKNMEFFVKFAEEAALGRKTMIVSHCDLQPPTYASTGETADYLLAKLHLERSPAAAPWPDAGYTPKTACAKGRFAVYGFGGEAGPDHMKHLQNIGRLYERLAEIEAGRGSPGDAK